MFGIMFICYVLSVIWIGIELEAIWDLVVEIQSFVTYIT